jgi:hypothetical protein
MQTPNNGLHPTRNTLALIFLQRCWRAGDAGRYAAKVERFAVTVSNLFGGYK